MASNDKDKGFSELRKFVNVLETMQSVVKGLVSESKDKAQVKNFVKSLEQQNPKAPVLNSENCVFYDVTGTGGKALQKLLADSKVNIPSCMFVASPTAPDGVEIEPSRDSLDSRPTVLAVPKQFAPQANLIFAQHGSLLVRPAQYMPRGNAVEMNRLLANAANTPSPMAINSIVRGTALVKTFEGGRWMPLVEQMDKQGIPATIVHNSKDNTTSVIFDQSYALQVDGIDRQIEKDRAPAELSYADFMNANYGRSIVEHSGLTEGQMHEIRGELRGSCAGYNVEANGNGTFTLRYSEERAQAITPRVISAIIKTNGANRDAIEAQASYISHQAENARNNVVNKQNLVICDATREDRVYTVDDRGLTGPDGKLMIRRNDPKFADTVHATVTQMQAPVVHTVPQGEEPKASAISKLEIAKAKEAHAAACPSEAGLMAAQIASLKASTALSKPGASVARVFNDAANSCRILADRTEEEFERAAPAENKGKIDQAELMQKYGLPGDRVPEAVTGFEQICREKKNPDELSQLAENMRTTAAGTFQSQMKVNVVTGDRCSLVRISNILDGQDRGPERGRNDRNADINMNGMHDHYESENGYTDSVQDSGLGDGGLPSFMDDMPMIGGD